MLTGRLPETPQNPGSISPSGDPVELGSSLAPSIRHLAAVAMVLAIGGAAYASAFRGPLEFVLDDVFSIVENPLLRELGNYFASPAGYRASPNRVVAYATFALNYAFGGLDPLGYRVANVGIHLLNALLVYALVTLAFRSPVAARSGLATSSRSVALVSAALFVAHPVQTQAVTYVVQRMTSLATTLYLLSVVCYAWWRLQGARHRVRGPAAYALVLLASVLAMKTKEIAFTLPLAIALLETILFEGGTKRRLLYVAPVLVTLAVIPLTMLDLGSATSDPLAQVAAATMERPNLSRWDYLVTQAPVVATYLRLLVAPFGQNLDYDFPLYGSFFAAPVLLSAAVIASLAALALALLRRSAVSSSGRPLDPAVRLVAFGIAWFFLTLSVESSFVPIQDVINEHRIYLPSAGLFPAIATGGALLLHRFTPGREHRLLLAAGALLGCVLGALTFSRNAVWQDNVSLWSDVVRKSPNKARPHVNLGRALMERGQADAAIAHYEAALRADPLHVHAHNNLGVALYKKSRVDEAIAHLELAVRLRPGDGNAHYNLGVAYGRKGRMELAQHHMRLGMQLRAGKK